MAQNAAYTTDCCLEGFGYRNTARATTLAIHCVTPSLVNQQQIAAKEELSGSNQRDSPSRAIDNAKMQSHEIGETEPDVMRANLDKKMPFYPVFCLTNAPDEVKHP